MELHTDETKRTAPEALGPDMRARFERLKPSNVDIPPDFWPWLAANRDLWNAFCKMADRARNVRENYSARTIIEAMRWHTEIHEAGGAFKIGNNHVPHMARLYNVLVGREFFLLRVRVPCYRHTGDGCENCGGRGYVNREE